MTNDALRSVPSATGAFIRGVGTDVPATRYSKAECLSAFERSDWFGRLDARSHLIARTVLQRDNGIDHRRLAVGSLDEVFQIDADTLSRRFATHAPALASTAAARALRAAGVDAQDIDALAVSTCTGYLCPGLSGYVAEHLGLRRDVQAFDLVGQGCGAALPNLRLGSALLGSGAAQHVLSVCVEVSSAAMYLDNDPGVLISACLFGDGAGAAVLSDSPSTAAAAGPAIGWIDSSSLTLPEQRDALRFESRSGLLRNVLTRAVPALAAEHAQGVLQTVLQALQRRLELPGEALGYSAGCLREYGNLSSAFVYFVLQAAIEGRAPAGWWWLAAFGAGFSSHGALLRVH